jgi:hypothetical protein
MICCRGWSGWADAGRKKLVTLVLGSDQERALRSAVEATVAACGCRERCHYL